MDGQGETIIDFICNKMKPRIFRKAIRECRWLTEAEVRKTWIEAGDEPNNTSGYVSCDIANKHSMLYPGLSRDTGGEILGLIQDGTFTRNIGNVGEYKNKTFTTTPVRGLIDSSSFAKDGLFCEYAYTLDLDENTLTVNGETLTFKRIKTLGVKDSIKEFKKLLNKDE